LNFLSLSSLLKKEKKKNSFLEEMVLYGVRGCKQEVYIYIYTHPHGVLEMLLVEFKLGWTFLIEVIAELVEFFSQNRCPTVEYP
jgi:hypothetical protein